jgi:hypothetical protein
MMYAFAVEVINKINIKALTQRLDHMVEKRFKGRALNLRPMYDTLQQH